MHARPYTTILLLNVAFPFHGFLFQVRRLLDNLLREAAQKRQDVALGTFGGMTAECACLPIVDVNGRLVKRNLLPDVSSPQPPPVSTPDLFYIHTRPQRFFFPSVSCPI